jgi:hypothetical protein
MSKANNKSTPKSLHKETSKIESAPSQEERSAILTVPECKVQITRGHKYYNPIRHPDAYACFSHSRLWQAPLRRDFFAGHRGFLQLPHHPSHHVAADTLPVRAVVSDSFRQTLSAFAHCRPSQSPEFRVTGLRLRSLYVATWCVADSSFRAFCRRAPTSCFCATAPPKLRSLSLLASVGLPPTG